MVYDARYNTKVYLTDVTKGIQSANILKDDGVTEATWIVSYSDPEYPLERVFFGTKNVDMVVSILKPHSTPIFGASATPIGYEEHLPLHIQTVTKQGINGIKLLSQGELEIRRILETYPYGSHRSLGESRDITESQSTTIYGVEIMFNYRRGVT